MKDNGAEIAKVRDAWLASARVLSWSKAVAEWGVPDVTVMAKLLISGLW